MKGYELGKYQYVCPYFKYIPCRIYVHVIIIEIFLFGGWSIHPREGITQKKTNKMVLSTIERNHYHFLDSGHFAPVHHCNNLDI